MFSYSVISCCHGGSLNLGTKEGCGGFSDTQVGRTTAIEANFPQTCSQLENNLLFWAVKEFQRLGWTEPDLNLLAVYVSNCRFPINTPGD